MAKQPPNKIKLNALTLARLKPRAKPFLVWDTMQHGLALQIHPSGNRTFKVIYSRHNRTRWYTIGRVGLNDARRIAARVMLAVAEGKDPQAERKAARSTGTFAELAERHRAASMKKNKSWQQADALVKRYLLPRWGNLQASEIARADVKAMMARTAAPILANQVLATASAVFAFGIKEELVKVNPCIGVERNATAQRERILTDSEIPLFWEAFDSAGLVKSMALKMILLCGQRPGEVAHMRTEHIAEGWWTLPGDTVAALKWPGTKNANTHRVWLPKAAQEIIAEMESEGFVFAGARGNAIADLDRAMRDICKALGVERATPHDLRRTHGSTVTALGFGRDAMNRIQNHREGGIADVYDRHQYAEENKRIMEAVANKIMSLIEGGAANNVIPLRN